MHSEEERLLEALEAGASGFLMKDAADRELIDAIRAVAAGEVYVRPRVARLLAARVRGAVTPAVARGREELAALSERERTVVRMIAEGYNGPEIGRHLGISAKTVDTYKQRVEEKLGLTHRTEYVRFALELDLLHK
jgi:DNA-binding NarL/FixJ family response regulator